MERLWSACVMVPWLIVLGMQDGNSLTLDTEKEIEIGRKRKRKGGVG
jgi:hypothetical protein